MINSKAQMVNKEQRNRHEKLKNLVDLLTKAQALEEEQKQQILEYEKM